ncbi:MAG: dihydrolipoyl dehydrogenase [Ottowia sp.]|nr:dihydrolipoyl dehydrogenase [Ottowia sp.]
MTHKTTLAIIGAGSAGLTALKEAQRVTDDIILINHGPYGTTCARVGCMPSKALIAPAQALQRRSFMARAGVRGTDALSVDLPAVLRHVRALRDRFVQGPIELAESLGARSFSGRARFVDANTLEVGAERITAERTIIATGSRPIVPDAWKTLGPRVLTSDDVFEQEDLGPRVAVVGLGAVGTELGQALALLGLQVTGLTQGETVAGLTDPAVSNALLEALRKDMRIVTGVQAELEPLGETAVRVRAGGEVHDVDWVLASLGRRPNLEGLGLEQLGVALDARGMPAFDRQTLRLDGLPIYIAGDASGIRPILHEAADEGRIAAYHALHPDTECLARRARMGVVFTEPGAAVVGRSLRDLQATGTDFVAGEADFSRQSRALMEGRNAGLLRVYLDSPDGRILGAEIAAPAAEHLAHLLAWAIQAGMTVDDVLQLPFYHPVVEEGLRSALQAARRALGKRRVTPDLPLCGEPAAWALGGD